MKQDTPDDQLRHRIHELEQELALLKAELATSVQRLQEEKSKSDAILAAIGDPVLIIDTHYQIIYQNDIANNLFGENLGRYCYDAYQGRSRVCDRCAVTTAWQDGRIHKIDKVMTSPRGTKYVEIAASPLKNSAGEIFAGIEIVRDVTKRRLAEESLLRANTLLKSILESTTDGILAVDRDGNLLGYNKNFTKLWNIPSDLMANYGDGRVLNSVLGQLEHPDVFINKVHSLYQSPNKIDLDVIHFKDGRVVERYSKPLVIDGDNIGRVWSFRDTTNNRKAEIERKELIDRLQAALAEVKKLSGFLPICSHCKKIRDDQGYWKQIETYIQEHSEAEFSHGICPECLKEHYPGFKG